MKKKITRVLVAIFTFIMLVSSAFAGTVYTVNANNARLRDPDDINIVITTLKKGTKVTTVGGKKRQMIKVKTSGGKVGYIYRSLLTKGNGTKKSGYYTKCSTALYINKNGKPVKKNALKKGVKVKLLQTKGKWAKIKTPAGNTYYCKKANLKKY